MGAIVAGITAWWLAQVVKAAVDRGRPYSFITDVVQRPRAPDDGLGFLSGHATMAFALAAVLSPYLTRRLRVVAYGLAGAVAFARVHLGAHFPLDVVAGAALGYGLGWLWNLAVGVPADVPSDAQWSCGSFRSMNSVFAMISRNSAIIGWRSSGTSAFSPARASASLVK